MAQQPPYTTVGAFLNSMDMPDPTVPVPFERFSDLKSSDDMLVRAAFWCFLAAWDLDKAGKASPAGLAVEARHDGHTLRAITTELAVRDCVLITRRDLAALETRAQENMYALSGHIGWLGLAAMLTLGCIIGVLLYVAGAWLLTHG